jgi:hypothetical protein
MRALLWIISLVLLIIIGSILIFGGGKKPKPNPHALKPLIDYAYTDSNVTMTIDGHINGDDIHRQIRITVDQNQRVMDIVQGYSGNVIDHHAFTNTPDAYNVFLHAINNGGFLLARKGITSNYIGQCPTGERFIYTLDQDGSTLATRWTSDCGSNVGNLAGDPSTLEELFQNQITGYNDLTADIQL